MFKDRNKKKLLFTDFIAHLKRQGFVIGVDHHLRLQVLLNKLGPTCRLPELKYLLCPIFATNIKQQQQFYRAFDSFFKIFEASDIKKSTLPVTQKEKLESLPVKPLRVRIWPYLFIGIVLIASIAVSIYWHENRPQKNITEQISVSKPHTPDSSLTIIKTDTLFNEPTFSQRYGNSIRWIVILTLLVIFLLTEWYRFNRRRLILQKQQGMKPPLIWPIQVETPELSFTKTDHFYSAARQLRQRFKSEIYHIDVDKTISSTLNLAGFPDLHYKAFTKPPEYLILIDLPSYRNHYSHLFDNITKALESEGVFVTRYFYENDPRICFRKYSGQRIYLSDLQTRYSDTRLILFGNCEELLNPISGELDRWTSLFHMWHDRAILTPEPPIKWGVREVMLAHDFVVLPASLDGISALIDNFEPSVEQELKAWKKDGFNAPELKSETDNNVTELRKYLGEESFQWLCACAVYPELQLDLTLYLGSLPCMPGNLISEKNLLRIIQLPWFRQGIMPDEIRWALINELDKEKAQTIRRAIIDLLERNPAPEESLAFDNYQLNLVVQKWMLSRKDRRKRREFLKTVRILRERQSIQDYTLIRFLESTAKSPLSLVLPHRLRKIFYRKGVPAFGLKTSLRMSFILLAIFTVFFVIKKPSIPGNITSGADPYFYELEIETTLGYEVQRPVRLFNCTIWVDGRQGSEYYQNEGHHIFHIPFERMYEISFERQRGLAVADTGNGLIPMEIAIKAMPYDETTGDTITVVLPRSRPIMIQGDETQNVQRQLQNNRQEFQIKRIVFKRKYLKQKPKYQ